MEEELIIQITKKGKKILKETERVYQEWLKFSNLTDKELINYKNVQGFHIIDKEEGIALGYYDEDRNEQLIGSGIDREQFNTATWLFAYICAKLDEANEHKGKFSTTFIKWGRKYDKEKKYGGMD